MNEANAGSNDGYEQSLYDEYPQFLYYPGMASNIYSPLDLDEPINMPILTSRCDSMSTMSNLDSYDRASNSVNGLYQSWKVTMKLDISYTEHSHIIGKAGNNIKSLMAETGCNVHFPDSNRQTNVEKSNQVTISGVPENVETTRQKIREMSPMVYSYEYPRKPFYVLEEQDRLIIIHLQESFEVLISYLPMNNFSNGTVVFVRGVITKSKDTIKATNILLTHHFGDQTNLVPVVMTMEVDPKHHSFLLNQGYQNSLYDEIHRLTGANIRFPDNSFSMMNAGQGSNRMGFSRLYKKTTIYILGNAESVFEARQLIINRLPVSIMYEVSIEEGLNIEMCDLNSISDNYNVDIGIKLRMRQFTKGIMLRTTERNIPAAFQVRDLLNKLKCQSNPFIFDRLKTLSPLHLKNMNEIIERNLPFAINNDNDIPANTGTINQGYNGLYAPNYTNDNAAVHPFGNHSLNNALMQYNNQSMNGYYEHRPNFFIGSPNGLYGEPTPMFSTNYNIENNLQMPITTMQHFSSFNFTSQTNEGNEPIVIRGAESNAAVQNDWEAFASVNNRNLSAAKFKPKRIYQKTQVNRPYVQGSIQSSIHTSALSSNVATSSIDWRAPGIEYSTKQREKKTITKQSSPQQSIDELTERCSEISIRSFNKKA